MSEASFKSHMRRNSVLYATSASMRAKHGPTKAAKVLDGLMKKKAS